MAEVRVGRQSVLLFFTAKLGSVVAGILYMYVKLLT